MRLFGDRGALAPLVTDRSSEALDDHPVATLLVDGCGVVTEANRAAIALLGRSRAVLIGMDLPAVLGRDLLWTSPEHAGRSFDVRLVTGQGTVLDVTAVCQSAFDASLRAISTIALMPKANPVYRRSAAPRVCQWSDVAEQAETAVGVDGEAICLAIAIVGLEPVNHGFSRSTGDFVLGETRRRLLDVMGAGAIAERVSGDRFVVISRHDRELERVFDLLLAAVRRPIETPMGIVAIGAAVGAAVGPARSALVLIDRASRNLDVAAARGPGTVEWLSNPQAPAPSNAARLAGPLIDAIERGGITAAFQPVVDLATTRVVEYEALARWTQSDSAILPASQFIDAARDTGALVDLGASVLRQALHLCARLRSGQAGAEGIGVSVNVSSREMADRRCVASVRAALEESGVPASALQLEMADCLVLDDIGRLESTVAQLRCDGVRIAHDNFGGTSANLMVLRDVVVDCVKLDPRIVAACTDDRRRVDFLRGLLQLCRQLQVQVVAKGVETVEQHELLRRLGCERGQGWLYGSPTSLGELHDRTTTYWVVPEPPARSNAGERTAAVRRMLASGSLDDVYLEDLVDSAVRRSAGAGGALIMVEGDHQWPAVARDIEGVDFARVGGFCAKAIDARPYLECVDIACSPPSIDMQPTADVVGSWAAIGAPVVLSNGLAIGVLCVLLDSSGGFAEGAALALVETAEHLALRIEFHHRGELRDPVPSAEVDAPEGMDAEVVDCAKEGFRAGL